MTFRVAASASYWYPVEIHFLTAAGKIEIRKIEVEFKRLSQTEAQDLLDPTAKPKTDRELINEVMLNWKGVEEEDASEMEFKPSNLDRFLAIVPTQSSIVKAFFKSLAGGARSGN